MGSKTRRSQRGLAEESRSQTACDVTGKWSFISRRGAKEYARRMAKRGLGNMRPFQCEHCDLYHIGHLPRKVVQGRT